MIKEIFAIEVLDSRAEKTIKCFVKTEKGLFSACVPAGKSKGKKEAFSLEPKKAIANIRRIAKRLRGNDETKQEEIDELLLKLDGTENKRKFGGNAMLAISLAVARAGAAREGKELFEYLSETFNLKISLPRPLFNVINGGLHIGEKGVQEHLIIPKTKKFSEGLEIGREIYLELKELLKKKFGYAGTLLGDEGGFAPKVKSVEERFELILKAAERVGMDKEISLGIDAASTNLLVGREYLVEGKRLKASELIEYYRKLSKDYPLVYVEDGLSEDDWENWRTMEKKLGKKLMVVGDDLLCTNPTLVKKAIKLKACNSMILKPNQVGTLSESVKAGKLGLEKGFRVIVSHRSGDTCDSFIADLSCCFGWIKAGAPARGERIAKYNRLLEIEEIFR